MKLYKELEQRSKEWHQIRKGSIGGTKAKKVVSASNMALLDELIAERLTDVIEDNYISDDMQRGIDLEPIAIAEFKEQTGIDVEHFGLVTNEKFEKCHLSPDGLILDNKLVGGVNIPIIIGGVEVKCPGSKKHIEYIRTNKIPAEYKYQILHYFAMCDNLETMNFVSFDPRVTVRPIHIVCATREEWAKDIEEYETKLLKFINKVQQNEDTIKDTF